MKDEGNGSADLVTEGKASTLNAQQLIKDIQTYHEHRQEMGRRSKTQTDKGLTDLAAADRAFAAANIREFALAYINVSRNIKDNADKGAAPAAVDRKSVSAHIRELAMRHMDPDQNINGRQQMKEKGNGNGGTSLVTVDQPSTLGTMILQGNPSDIMAMVQKREQVLQRCREVAIRSTNPNDWVKFGDKLWPQSGAVARLIHSFGVSIYDVSQTWEEGIDEDGPWYLCKYNATFAVPGLGLGPIQETGTGHSRDQFLSATRSGPDLRACILKKSETNCHARGTMKLLGIQATRDEFDRYWGADKSSQIGQVEFQKGGKGGGTNQGLTIPFGKEKGKTLPEASDNSLEWLANVMEERIADPENAKWKDKNSELLNAIRDELAHRRGDSKGAS